MPKKLPDLPRLSLLHGPPEAGGVSLEEGRGQGEENWPTEWTVLGDRTEAPGSEIWGRWEFLAGSRALVPAVPKTNVEVGEAQAGARAQISGWWHDSEWQGGETRPGVRLLSLASSPRVLALPE